MINTAHTTRELISQVEAAEMRGISKQRICQLRNEGRFTIPRDAEGNPIRGKIYKDEVDKVIGKRGRPRNPPAKPKSLDGFSVGDLVEWYHYPRDGFGFSIAIQASVSAIGTKKLKISFVDAEFELQFAWVLPENCVHLQPLE